MYRRSCSRFTLELTFSYIEGYNTIGSRLGSRATAACQSVDMPATAL